MLAKNRHLKKVFGS